MAISPPSIRGKERTSVGLSFFRKRRFNCCRRRFPAIRTSTSPATPISSCAFRAKRVNAGWFTPSTTFSKMITCSESKRGGPDRPPKSILLLQRRLRRLFSLSRRLGQLKWHLLATRAIAGPAQRPLNQVMANHVFFREQVEGKTRDILQHRHRFHDPALARVGQVE